jgi:hypothetical protein
MSTSVSIMADEVVVSLGAATALQAKLKYERALERKNPPRSFESFVEYVVERGLAEIERAWKTQEKSQERNELVKTVVAQVRYLKAKQAHEPNALTDAEKAFLETFLKA